MAVSDYSNTPASNTAISGTDVSENCAPAGINDAIRQLMADIKAFYDVTLLDSDIGSDVQAFSDNLTSLSGLTLLADRGLYSTGANTLALYTLAAQGRTFLSASTTSAQRTALGLGTMATKGTVNDGDPSVSPASGADRSGIAAIADFQIAAAFEETAERSITLLATDTFTHGNGSTPSIYDIYAICKTADSPYVVDEVIRVPDATQVGASEYGVTLSADATNFRIRVGAQIPMHTNAGAAQNMTVANWRFIVKWRA